MALAFLQQGIDPKRRVHCPGGIRIGNRYFRCDAVHGSVDMHVGDRAQLQHLFLGDWASSPIPQQTTEMVQLSRLWREIRPADPDPAFRHDAEPEVAEKKYKRKWQGYDSANTSIGQGYVLVNPMQLAVMPGRAWRRESCSSRAC